MNRNVSRKFVVALCLALVACLSVMATTAFAYYTDTSKANGLIAFSWTPDNPDDPDDPTDPEDPKDPDEPKTEVEEKLHGLDKTIAVKNTGKVAAFVRVQLIYPDPNYMDGKVSISVEAGEGWVKGQDNWYYYLEPIAPDAVTPTIEVKVEVGDKDNLRPFDIVVIQQCAKVERNAGGELCGTFVTEEGPVVIDEALLNPPTSEPTEGEDEGSKGEPTDPSAPTIPSEVVADQNDVTDNGEDGE